MLIVAWDAAVAARVLRDYFGHSAFRGQQERAIRALLAGQDVLYVAATGTGKSLCFQFPTLYKHALRQLTGGSGGSVTIIVSPLLSLMDDQVMALHALGVSAVALHGNNSRREDWDAAESGATRFIYITPESLVGWLPKAEALHARGAVDAIAIDEAHIVTEWGVDFRPEYRRLALLRERLPGVPIMAVTATATPVVREDIVRVLQLRGDCVKLLSSFDRPNLHYTVRLKSGSMDADVSGALTPFRGPTIVYVPTQADAERIRTAITSMHIRKGGEPAGAAAPAEAAGGRWLPFGPGHAARLHAANVVVAEAYHAGMAPEERTRVHQAFLAGSVDVVVATVAFGMGIDKRDIRCVVHYGVAKALETYYQQTGRAGRDGDPGACIMYYTPGDIAGMLRLTTATTAGRDQNRAGMESMQQFVSSARCRRRIILEHFGELPPEGTAAGPAFACAGCDNCDASRATSAGGAATMDFTDHMRALAAAINTCGTRGGSSLPINLVRGSRVAPVLKRFSAAQLESMPFFGIGKSFSDKYWQGVLRMLEQHGMVRSEVSTIAGDGSKRDFSFVAVACTPAGTKFVRNTAQRVPAMPVPVDMQAFVSMRPGDGATAAGGSHGRSTAVALAGEIELTAEERMLLQALEDVRTRMAAATGMPAYAIATNKTLRAMARSRPVTSDALAAVEGMGASRATTYGADFLKAVLSHNAAALSGKMTASPLVPVATHVGARSVTMPTVESLTPAQQAAWDAVFLCGGDRIAIAATKGVRAETMTNYIVEAITRGALWAPASVAVWWPHSCADPVPDPQLGADIVARISAHQWHALQCFVCTRLRFSDATVSHIAAAIVSFVSCVPDMPPLPWIAGRSSVFLMSGELVEPVHVAEMLAGLRLKPIMELVHEEAHRQYDVLKLLLWFTRSFYGYGVCERADAANAAAPASSSTAEEFANDDAIAAALAADDDFSFDYVPPMPARMSSVTAAAPSRGASGPSRIAPPAAPASVTSAPNTLLAPRSMLFERPQAAVPSPMGGGGLAGAKRLHDAACAPVAPVPATMATSPAGAVAAAVMVDEFADDDAALLQALMEDDAAMGWEPVKKGRML